MWKISIYITTLFFLFQASVNGSALKISYDICPPQYQFDGQKLLLTEREWKQRLTAEQFDVLRRGGSEPPFKNAYYNNKRSGVYECAGCGLVLFSSHEQYNAGTGWPSFFAPICKQNVSYRKEGRRLFSKKIEILCSKCDGHIGHLFNDGPAPTGKRYSANSAALTFIAK